MNPRVPMGHLRTEIMSNSCDPQHVLSTAEMRRRRTLRGEKGPPPGAMASDVESSTWFWSMGATCGSKAGVADGGVSEDHGKKMGFACREELAIKGVKPNKLIPSQ